MILESESDVAQSCLTLWAPMNCNLPGSSVHGIFQARIQEWVAISFSRGSSLSRDQTRVSRIVGRCFTIWATREGQIWRLSSNPEGEVVGRLLWGHSMISWSILPLFFVLISSHIFGFAGLPFQKLLHCMVCKLAISHCICHHSNKKTYKVENVSNQPPDLCLAGVKSSAWLHLG